jgi:hypothetical protein
MKKLKKRLTANSPGLILGVIAIVLALTGGAIAASGALNGTQKKEVKKIAQTEAKKFATQGPKGDPGPAGATGPQGGKGDAGTAGTNGKDGVSAEATSFSGAKAPCTEGGVEIKSAKPTALLCNGEKGEEGEEGEIGPEGSPWTAGGTLPPGSTETGSWAYNGTTEDTTGIRVPISFPIPFPFNLKEAHVHYVAQAKIECEAEAEPGQAECLAKLEAACPSAETPGNPGAAAGELCVYENAAGGRENATFDGIYRYFVESTARGAVRSGALLNFIPTGIASGAGSFAVTGCTKTVQAPADPEIECPAGS